MSQPPTTASPPHVPAQSCEVDEPSDPTIVDPASGKQPLFSLDRKLILAANGEIYNHREIRSCYKDSYKFQTQSDCEVILALYKQKGVDFLDDLNGIFGFAIYDVENDESVTAVVEDSDDETDMAAVVQAEVKEVVEAAPKVVKKKVVRKRNKPKAPSSENA